MVTDTSENTRNYGLDLLKIICMFGIIGFHFTNHGAVELRDVTAYVQLDGLGVLGSLGRSVELCVHVDKQILPGE